MTTLQITKIVDEYANNLQNYYTKRDSKVKGQNAEAQAHFAKAQGLAEALEILGYTPHYTDSYTVFTNSDKTFTYAVKSRA